MRECRQRVELFDAYRSSLKAYMEIVKRLRGAVSGDYEFLHKRVELARTKMVAAREKLNLHMAMHRCEVGLGK